MSFDAVEHRLLLSYLKIGYNISGDCRYNNARSRSYAIGKTHEKAGIVCTDVKMIRDETTQRKSTADRHKINAD
jgi:hypothetical protein